MLIDSDSLADRLKSLPLLQGLLALTKGTCFYVVGGAVRDALVGLPVRDIDLIFPEDPTALAKLFATTHGGHWFWLDEERRQSRVVFNNGQTCPVFDFASFRAPSLELDLFDRDFTINALALDLSADVTTTSLVDPAGGLDDLQQNLLRMVSGKAFANDPLRIVKGVRHATTLDLRIDDHTLDSMHAEITGLYRVAVERIRQEIWQILASGDVAKSLSLLDATLIGNYLFGNLFSGRSRDLAELSVVICNCWRKLSLHQPVIAGWLAREVEQGLNYQVLLLWTILLVRLDADLPRRLAEEWLLSRKAKAYVNAVAGIDEKTLEELDNVNPARRAFAWWAHDYRIEPRLWLLALAAIDALKQASRYELICDWVTLVDELDDQPPDELVDGHWLQHEIGLPAGPQIARALHLLKKAEIFGLVSGPESARKFLQHHYKNID